MASDALDDCESKRLRAVVAPGETADLCEFTGPMKALSYIIQGGAIATVNADAMRLIGCIVIDAAHRIAFANERANELLGYGPFELIDKPVEDLLPAAVRERHPGMVDEWVGQGCPVRERFPVTGVRRDGEHVRLSIGVAKTTWRDAPAYLAALLPLMQEAPV